MFFQRFSQNVKVALVTAAAASACFVSVNIIPVAAHAEPGHECMGAAQSFCSMDYGPTDSPEYGACYQAAFSACMNAGINNGYGGFPCVDYDVPGGFCTYDVG